MLILGLLFVNYHARQTGTADFAPLVSMENTNDTFTLLVAGRSLSVDKGRLHKARPLLQKLTLFVPSTVRGLAAVWNGLDQYVMRGYPSEHPVPGLSLPLTLGQS